MLLAPKLLNRSTLMALLALSTVVVLNGCASRATAPASTRTPPPSAGTKPPNTASKGSGGYYLDDGPSLNPPQNLDSIADAVPRDEALHRGANKPYTVFGKSYVPNVAITNFQQTGVASWYGRKYHGQKTSIGETYNMYAMTAAHPTLPLPSYVRVTNQSNGKTVVVRVNDRGPFLQDRVIDLSYVAAYKLDYLRQGSARVFVERVFAGDTPPTRLEIPTPPTAVSAIALSTAPTNSIVSNTISAEEGRFYLQLGAFGSIENAENFQTHLLTALSSTPSTSENSIIDWNKHSISLLQKNSLVRVRLGPMTTRAEAEVLAKRIRETLQLTPTVSAHE